MADPPVNASGVARTIPAGARSEFAAVTNHSADCGTAAPVPSVVAGRYRLSRRIGAGGSGTVWLARDQVLGRRVALKQVRRAPGPGRSASALHEARAAARVSHPNVVAVYDIVTGVGDHSWLVMEALSGGSLAEAIAGAGRLRVERVNLIARCLLLALDRLHSAGLVHRDVKPSNIHLGLDGRIVLTDFGVAASLARRRSDNKFLTGTLGYIAPESVTTGSYSAASDMYSLGATLFCAVQGARPFDIQTLEDLLEYAAVPVTTPCPDQAKWLTPLITGLLEPRPCDRWTAGAALAHLR